MGNTAYVADYDYGLQVVDVSSRPKHLYGIYRKMERQQKDFSEIYDIAAIRTGARPVYATRTGGDGKVEIIWQELVNFDSVTVGRMIIQVTDTGLTATRGPGDASKGFGTVSSKPLAGEDVLVRRLADAASQAIEKGLAKKVRLFPVILCTETSVVERCSPYRLLFP